MEAKIILKKSKANWDVKVQYLSWNKKWTDKATFKWWSNAMACIKNITDSDDRIVINTANVSESQVTETKTKIKLL